MKCKKLMTTLLLSLMATSLFTSCGEKEHNFSAKWESDENYHWHVCQTDGHTDTTEKEKHVQNNGSVIKEPTSTENGLMKYVCITCLRETTDIIEKLNEQTKYTITFDSKGGSAVNSITAEAGSAINAPDNPTKAGYEFVGWYEINDFGATLNDTPFTFSYMPARVFTLYAKWGLESIKGKTFNHTDSIVTFSCTDEEKEEFLKGEELTEEELVAMNKAATIKFVFDETKDIAKTCFGLSYEGSSEYYETDIYYKITNQSILFYDTEEDMKKGITATKYGFFKSFTGTISKDKKTMVFSGGNGFVRIDHILTLVGEI